MTEETQLIIGTILIWLTWSSVFLWEWFWRNSKKTKEASAESEGDVGE